MKRIFVLTFCLFFAVLTYAQSDTSQFRHFDQGRNMIGADFSVGWGAGMFAGHIQMRYGHFLQKKLVAGVETGYRSFFYKSGNIGPYVRYYIINGKLAPFVEANYTYELSRKSNKIETWKGSSHIVAGLGGLAYTGIFKRFGIELYLEYGYGSQRFYIDDHVSGPGFFGTRIEDGTFDYFIYGLRINYHF